MELFKRQSCVRTPLRVGLYRLRKFWGNISDLTGSRAGVPLLLFHIIICLHLWTAVLVAHNVIAAGKSGRPSAYGVQGSTGKMIKLII